MSNIATHLRYTVTHEWLNVNEQEASVGITDHAQALLGDLVFIELPEIGRKVAAGEELGVVESVKAASDFYAPVAGTIIAVNEAASNNPASVNQNPHTVWLVKLQLDNTSDADTLLDAVNYAREIGEDH